MFYFSHICSLLHHYTQIQFIVQQTSAMGSYIIYFLFCTPLSFSIISSNVEQYWWSLSERSLLNTLEHEGAGRCLYDRKYRTRRIWNPKRSRTKCYPLLLHVNVKSRAQFKCTATIKWVEGQDNKPERKRDLVRHFESR